MATHGNFFAVTDSGEKPTGGGGTSQVYLLPPTQMANDPQPEVDVSLSTSGGLGYFSSAFGFRGGIVGASFATALPGDPSLPNSTTFGDQILASAGWLQEPGQPNGDHTTHSNPYTDDILFSLNVPLDIQERFGKRDMLSLPPKDRHVEEWWVGGIYRHSAWQVGNTFFYVVTHEPKEWFIFSGGVTTIATAQFRFDGTEIGRDLALEELRNSQVLNNLGTTALAAQENGQAAGMVLLTITTTVTPFPDEGLLILAAGKKGFDVVKAGRASYHIYRDGKRLTGQAERNAAKLIMDENSNDVAPGSGAARHYGGAVDTRLINHGFGPSKLGTDRLRNCLSCSLATDATWAGHAATALPRTSWYPRTFADGLRMVENWIGNGKTFSSSSLANIRSAVSGSVGNRGIVVGMRADGTSHAFNVINKNGAVHFFDGQANAAIRNLDEFRHLYFLPTNF